jgi:aromatic ring-opening dioxygenase catalytic subunit (LigB family)
MTVAPNRLVASLGICHGGGPLPLLGHQPELIAAWKQDMAQLVSRLGPHPSLPSVPNVDAIIVVSAHYETRGAPRVLGNAAPKIIFDYGGFPPEAYKLQYPAPGHPALAARLVAAMRHLGTRIAGSPKPELGHTAAVAKLMQEAAVDSDWGYDHGVFVPLLAMVPEPVIPVVVVTSSITEDTATQLAVGEAIREALDGGSAFSTEHPVEAGQPSRVLVLGSGSSFHNFSYMRTGRSVHSKFNGAVQAVLRDAALPLEARKAQLLKWRELPDATVDQPVGGSEHWMPFLTVAAAAGYKPTTWSQTVVNQFRGSEFLQGEFLWAESV